MIKEGKKVNKPGLKVFHKGLILVFAPLLIEMVLISALAFVLLQLDKESIAESRYRRCAAIGAHLVVLADQAAIDVIAWFQFANPELMKAYDRVVADVQREEKQLKELTHNDPLAKQSASDLIESIDSLAGMLDDVARLAKQQRLLEMAAIIPKIDKEFKATKNTHLEHIGAVTSAQEKIAEECTLRQDKLRLWQRQIILFGLIANAVIALALLVFFRRSISDRLQVVRQNTNCLAENRPLAPGLEGSDEIWQLDLAFHSMDADLKEASARERSLFDKASDVICVLNAENIFERINPACQKHWGFSAEELISNSVLEIVDKANADKTISLFQSARQGGDEALFELILKKKDGNFLETLWSSYWSDKEKLLFCVVHDISERKRIERMKQSYLALISSDLKVPLASIASAAERLAGPLAGSLSERALARIELVRTNLERLLLLVNDLLEMSALESGSLTLAKKLSNVEHLLQRSCHDLEGLAQKRKVTFRIECTAGDCLLDPNRIMQVIVNLASNAVKFSPEGGEVALLASSNANFLEVKVSDRGRGVPESHKRAIFEKFKQVEASDGKRSAGTGLGLPICKDIVEEHGGEIGVDSQPGQGSTFWFRLPIDSESYEAIMAKKKNLPAKQSEPAGIDRGSPETAKSIANKNNQQGGSRLSLTKKGILLIALPLAVELAFVLSILNVIAQVNTSRQEELKQRQIASNCFKILNSYFKMIVLVSPSSTETYWLAFDKCCTTEQEARADIARLIRNDPASLRHFRQEEKVSTKLDTVIAHGRKLMNEQGYSNELMDEVRPDRFVLIATSSAVSKRLLALVDEAERKQAVTPMQQAQLRQQQACILFSGLAGNIVLSLLLARFFGKNISTRLATLADNTTRLSSNLPLNPLIPGSDEIAQLDRAFHATAEKLAEARRKERAVFDNSHDLIAALDSRLYFVSSNPASERLLGYSREELEEKSVLDLIDPAEKERAAQLFLCEDSGSGKTVETQIIRKDGSPAYLLWSLSRPEQEANIYCIAHDISDRKQLERLKQDFLAVVSHDLRNPLGSVIGFITLIRAGAMGEPGPEAIQSLDEINEQADRLLVMINDLLDLEKLEAQGMQLMLTEESAGQIAYKAFESISAAFPGFSLELPESNLEIFIDCDRERLTQAFSNIYTHIYRRIQTAVTALSSAADREKQVNPGQDIEPVRVLQLSFRQASGEVIWEIVDPGPAYSKKEQEQLFERFKTEADSRLENTGLALPIAKRIIEAHGASLTFNIDSAARQLFIISLPGPEERESQKNS